MFGVSEAREKNHGTDENLCTVLIIDTGFPWGYYHAGQIFNKMLGFSSMQHTLNFLDHFKDACAESNTANIQYFNKPFHFKQRLLFNTTQMDSGRITQYKVFMNFFKSTFIWKKASRLQLVADDVIN